MERIWIREGDGGKMGWEEVGSIEQRKLYTLFLKHTYSFLALIHVLSILKGMLHKYITKHIFLHYEHSKEVFLVHFLKYTFHIVLKAITTYFYQTGLKFFKIKIN